MSYILTYYLWRDYRRHFDNHKNSHLWERFLCSFPKNLRFLMASYYFIALLWVANQTIFHRSKFLKLWPVKSKTFACNSQAAINIQPRFRQKIKERGVFHPSLWFWNRLCCSEYWQHSLLNHRLYSEFLLL